MAEWLKALVLKTRDGNVRRFESCPFRQNKKKPRRGLFLVNLNFFGSDVESGAGGGVAR